MSALVEDWRRILRKAWSIKLVILAAIMSGLEVALGFADASLLGMPRGVFAALAGVVSLLALPARLIAQRSMQDVDSQN